jgi:hypothetical protein
VYVVATARRTSARSRSAAAVLVRSKFCKA